VTRLWILARRYGFEALIALGALASALDVCLRDEAHMTRFVAAPAVALVVLSLLARRWWRFAGPAALWLMSAALSFADGRLIVSTGAVFIAGLASAFLLGNVRDDFQGRLGLAVLLGGALTVVANDPRHSVGEFIFIPIPFAILWLAGYALRERAAQAEAAEERARQAERERETSARIAVAEERARIARELHDIVAHAVSVMVLQVGAVRHRLPDLPAEEGDALRGVEHTGRTALAEMRHLLGAMRHDGEGLELAPQPGLAGVDALLDEVRRAGLPVALHVDGDPVALPRALDLSAYRIIQEGLTNALKHARAGQADVRLRYGRDELAIDVCDDGAGATAGDGLGQGLIGVRERVTIYGGEMTAGPHEAGGFLLSTRLPLGSAPR
jgi:signal transduction histidine kinase